MLKRAVFLMFFVLFLTAHITHSQMFEEWQPIEEPSAGNSFGVGARYMGMGGAGVAFCNDASALIYNPAGLARIKRIELTLGMTHQRFKNQTGYLNFGSTPYYQNVDRLQSNTRLGSAGLVLPIPTYRGSLVFGLGVNRITSFDHTFKNVYTLSQSMQPIQMELISESGGIYVWSVGGAIDISPNTSLGLSLNFWNGKDDYTYIDSLAFFVADTFYEINDDWEFKDDYSGFNLKFGIMLQPNKYLSLGGVISSPVWLTVDEEYFLNTDSTPYYPNDTLIYIYYIEETGYPKWKLTHPFSFTFGGAFNFKNLLLAADFNYTDWTQLQYREGYRSGVKNIDVKEYYQDVFKWHIGAEYLVPQISGKLRAGFYEDPLPFKSSHLKSDRRFITLGLGFLIDQVMTLDISWNRGFYDFEYPELDVREKYTTNKIFITTAYRL
ncbi:MAG: hypothetical protein AMJ90_01985 [candidate division Zixibacteria bacterium SM23_73_2]|nr:MAG: hypothetical protein AMJ90_01985 [candidate division Zixibacteria bacterium SM23_73_2]